MLVSTGKNNWMIVCNVFQVSIFEYNYENSTSLWLWQNTIFVTFIK